MANHIQELVFCCLMFSFSNFILSMCLLYLFLADVCQDYQRLTDPIRKHDFATENPECDQALSGWYRFERGAGTQMVTNCPPKGSCNADYPIWLKGDHPTVAEGTVPRMGCINKGHHCCEVQLHIQVKNCSSYYVYKLGNLRDCNARYCTTD